MGAENIRESIFKITHTKSLSGLAFYDPRPDVERKSLPLGRGVCERAESGWRRGQTCPRRRLVGTSGSGWAPLQARRKPLSYPTLFSSRRS